jgi:4-hydroxybenzoate polyprenyltransferase
VIRDLLETMRPNQWVKNGAVFAALVFSKNVFDPRMVHRVVTTFLLFCLVSGTVYIFNDVLDRRRDRLHPAKRDRPIASGRLDARSALSFAILLFIVSLLCGFLTGGGLGWLLLLYFGLNFAYSVKLKEIVLIDVFAIAAGFVIRVLSGAVVIEVEISSWLIVCTILLALFLAFSKRRHEIVVLEGIAGDHRKILSEYSTAFLDQMISVVTASTVVCYTLYTVSEETVAKFQTKALIYTVPFVLYGIFRYLYLIHLKRGGGNPSVHLLTDVPLIVNILLWIFTAAMIIYYNP